MICTITFSPCIDKSASVPSMQPEKKLRCSAPVLEPGGGGINVARAVNKLGGEALAIYPAGGYTGQYFSDLLRREQVPCHVIPSSEETRENIIILDESTQNQYRFGMPGTALQEREWQSCLDACQNLSEGGWVVASGSLPPGVPPDVYSRLARIVKKNGGSLIVDTSGEALHHALQEGVFLVKPNLGELATLVGKEVLGVQEAAQAARMIIQQGGAVCVLVSMGKSGALFVTADRSVLLHAPQVIRKSTVGAGDSMVAGLVFSLSAGKLLEEAVRYAVACGTAATMNPGTALCKKEDADRLFSQVHVMPLQEQ